MLEDGNDINVYLQQEVLAASPIRLRWMLITRAKELCEGVDSLWRDGQHALGDQWALRIREILGELLAGITEGNPASKQVSDFYLFLLKLLSRAEQTRDRDELSTLRDLLAIEADTWQLLLQKPSEEVETSVAQQPSYPSSPAVKPAPIAAPIVGAYDESSDYSSGSSFSLDM